MEIVNFFETLAGKWFSQRTTHYLATQTSKAGQSNLMIEFLPHINAAVMKLCEELGQDSAQAACGLRINQDSRIDGETQSVQTAALMVALQPSDDQSGVLLQKTEGADQGSVGHYTLADEVMTIAIAAPGGQVEERLWFANPNVRMRTSVLQGPEGVKLTSFCSEIRLGVSRPPEE
ncbi:phycobiliprotein lyase [Pseudanabaena sp. FACHB-2040]|uniref:phycobiliprotein lyase n=1 Tax=Pseudanabaena sp. FACHB-2040 TaxID=2692859 RepID=UPI0016842B18|nr:phycobiliprotein lyase [Pseudanabaena sp. FACHB-2040]MBD2259615.1 phycobiliprotein lyase [Pseudanabaena sp. FACHB-2040]